MSKRYNLTGVAGSVEFSKNGNRLKNSGTELQVRNTADAAFVNMSGLDATLATHFVTLSQAQALANGLFWIDPVLVVETVGDLLLTGEQTIDGVLTSTSRVLLTVQTDPIENGVWVTAAGAWTRPADFDTGDGAANKTMMIGQGSAGLADSQWTCTTNSPSDIIDTDALAFVQIASTIAGVTSLQNGAGTGQSIINTGGPTGAITTKAILGGVAITASTATSDIVLDVDALGITTGLLADASVTTVKIAAAAVTEAKIAPTVVNLVRFVLFDDGDVGMTVNIGAALPANAVVTEVRVSIGTVFDAETFIDIGTLATPNLLMDQTLINSAVVDVYSDDLFEGGAGATQLVVSLSASGATAGDGGVWVSFFTSM
jgi:hypothetical protein